MHLPPQTSFWKARICQQQVRNQTKKAELLHHLAQMAFQGARKVLKGLASPLVLMEEPQKGGTCPECVPTLAL